jgi:beta-xylosidase
MTDNASNLMKNLLVIIIAVNVQQLFAQKWIPDLGNGSYKNPVIWADYSDPDVIRVGDDFYMTASSFNCVPALPLLHSNDLVNWQLINYAVKRFPDSYFDVVQHGNGVWAPSIRFHDDWFYIYWGDPDRGIYMVRTQDPYGDWSAPVLVKKAAGNIDPCPLWDEDGRVYLVHAFANSRAGVSNILQVQELSEDATVALSNRMVVFNASPGHRTMEGPKFYKRSGFYYIFTPAGGVAEGYQMVLRAKNPFGPYEERTVLAQGNTGINGPHQGGWVELENGENWFIHFQEKQPYGRIVHLQPVKWIDDWPVIGADPDNDGIGEPVAEFNKPEIKKSSTIKIPQTSDEFNESALGLAWQWQANDYPHWYSLKANPGHLRLYAQYNPDLHSLWMVPNLLLQKLPAPEFTVTTKIRVSNLKGNEKAGLIVMGLDYASLTLAPAKEGYEMKLAICRDAISGSDENTADVKIINVPELFLKVSMDNTGICRFACSENGTDFQNMGGIFQAREGRWIGAKIGIFAVSSQETGMKGFADFDWFRIE